MNKLSMFKSKKAPLEANIQITSMTDIFIILLLFMLKYFNSSELTKNISKDLSLPVASGISKATKALSVTITEQSVLLEDKLIISLKNFNPPSSSLVGNQAINQLVHALFEFKKDRKQNFYDDDQMTSNILILADKKTPYQTIKYIVASAAMAGIDEVQLVYNKSNE